MTGNERQKTMNLIVRMPATLKQISNAQNNTNSQYERWYDVEVNKIT